MKKQWCVPAKYHAEFVARMEDILEVYALAYDKDIPLICMDEQPVQLPDEKIKPIPMNPGKMRKQTYEYVRKGTCGIFVFTEPLASWRHVSTSQARGKLKHFYPNL